LAKRAERARLRAQPMALKREISESAAPQRPL
jgi:hypothetical protein